MIQLKTFTQLIKKIKSLKNKKQILSFLYEYHFNEIHKDKELEAIKANNFGLIDGFSLEINKENLLNYGFIYKKKTNTFYYNIPKCQDKCYTEENGIKIHFLSNEFEIIFEHLSYKVYNSQNHNIKTIKELSDLIYTLTKHRIKKQSL